MLCIRPNAAPSVTRAQILTVAYALRLYACTGMKANRAYTPAAMQAFVTEATGQTFRGLKRHYLGAHALFELLGAPSGITPEELG